MPFNIPFCTITSHSSVEFGDNKVSDGTLVNPYYLFISSTDPALHPITSTDFKVTGAQQKGFGAPFYSVIQGHSEIEKVEFNDIVSRGVNAVKVSITLVNYFAMDNKNQIIDICIEGSAAISTTVTGNIFNIITSNI